MTPATLAPSLEMVSLGHTDIRVGAMGWGMWRMAGTRLADAIERVNCAVDAGCTLFDTADVYGYGSAGFGAAEELLGRVFSATPGLRARIVLASKGGVTPPVPYNSSSTHLVAACEASLRRLRVEYIDLYQIHRPDLLAHPAEVAGALETLRTAGKIRAAGISNYTVGQARALIAHMPFPLATIQPEFSVLAHSALEDGTLDLAMEHGLGVLAWSPLAQGRLSPAATEASALLDVLDGVAIETGANRTAVAYAWVMQHPSRPVPLIGSQNVVHIRQAAVARTLRLSREDWYRILVAARGAPMP